MRRSSSVDYAATMRSVAAHMSRRRRRKRARGANPLAAAPAALWRESRDANGRTVISVDSDSDDASEPKDVDLQVVSINSDSDSDAFVKAEPPVEQEEEGVEEQEEEEEMEADEAPQAAKRHAQLTIEDSSDDEDVEIVQDEEEEQVVAEEGGEDIESGQDDEPEEDVEEAVAEESDEEDEMVEARAEEEESEEEECEAEWQPEEEMAVSDPTPEKQDHADDHDSDVELMFVRKAPTASPPQQREPVIKQEPRIKPEPVPNGDNTQVHRQIPNGSTAFHPRATRRSVVRKRRLDDDRAGLILFSGRKYVPPAGVLKQLVELVARCTGSMTNGERQWLEFLVFSRLNVAADGLAVEFSTRFPDWMKIALGGGSSTSSRVQREPILPRPIRYTIRDVVVPPPRPPPASDHSKAKEKTTPTPSTKTKTKSINNAKWLEQRAKDFQGTGKRSSAVNKNQAPRRVVSVGVPQSTGPFSLSSSTASPSTRGRSTPVQRQPPERKRRRLFSPPNGAFSPSATPTFLDLSADDARTSGRNKSMPQDWSSVISTPALPASMSPLLSMSLAELNAHIQSVQQEGRARSVERPMEILQKLMSHPRNRHNTFNKPVDPVLLGLPTYFEVIKKPMDLGTIKERLEEGEYVVQDDFEDDMRLVFENAMRFNPPNHSVHVDAEYLLRLFDDLLHDTSLDRALKRRIHHVQPPNAEQHVCHTCLGNTCVLCQQGCLPMAQPQFQCAGSCGSELRRGSLYYATRDGTRVWCSKCRTTHVRKSSNRSAEAGGDDDVDDDDTTDRASQSTTDSTHSVHAHSKKKRKKKQPSLTATNAINVVEIDGELVQKKVDIDVEPWVKCSRCCRWLHQVCGLFNPIVGAHAANHDYICPLCVRRQRSAKPPPPSIAQLLNNDQQSKPLPEPDVPSSCHQLPECELSKFIEAFLKKGLRELNEISAADELRVRVMSFPDEHVVVPEGIVKTFDQNATLLDQQILQLDLPRHRFPSQIPFTSRGIYLFQRHEGADVCLFTLFVQEFGDRCTHAPNRRSVYVAYLDSIRYLKPPSARTAAYHLILMAYFDYIRRHGFERVHIWSCPPQKRISYVFWCRPSFQKTPSAEHLRSWYKRLLTKAQDAGIVQSWSNMYDRYLSGLDAPVILPPMTEIANGASTRGAASRSGVVDPGDHVWAASQLPPLFDGDFIPAELDRILGRLSARNAKYRRGSSGGKSNAVGSTGGKVAVGEFVARIKEEKPSPSTDTLTSAQVEFKLRDIFTRCQHAVQRLKNDLLVVDLVVDPGYRNVPCEPEKDVPEQWVDVPRFFGSRFMFHQLCATVSYQFDTLPRAKHSTMMLFHHYWNEQVTQLNVFCSDCFLLITHVDYWRCESCHRFAICDMCYRRDGASHVHGLVFGSVRRANSKRNSLCR